jgi:hypothetical protein
MASITNRQDFKNYCLRRLGYPVIEINVDDDQVEDRITDALQYFTDRHADGTQKVYYIRAISGSQLVSDIDVSVYYPINAQIVGGTSHATATVTGLGSSNTIIYVSSPTGTFVPGEPLKYYDVNNTLQDSGGTVSVYTLGDVDAHYLNMSEEITMDTNGNQIDIVGVSRIFPISDSQSNVNMFDLRYQLRLNELYDFTSASYINYTLTQQHLRSLEQMFTGEVPIRFNRHMKRLFIDWAWGNSEAPIGQVVIAECYAAINPESYPWVWNDRWLKEYTTALIKRTWGNNLSKFAGLQLPGGVTLDGKTIQSEAIAEIERLESEMEIMFGAPLEFFMN